jgi:hypothetical protein
MKKKMKTNQDGGSVTASDPAAAGKQLAADQKAGGARMGYSQKFGPERMNGYDAGAKKVMDVMTHGGATRYMAEGPGQGKFDEMNARLKANKEEAATTKAIEKQREISQMQADVKDGTRPGFVNPSQNQVDGSTYNYSQRLMVGGDKLLDPASDYTRNVTRGEDGYYKGDVFPKNRLSPSSQNTYSYTDDRTKNNGNSYQTNYQRSSFDFAKMDYEKKAANKAARLNSMIDKEKTNQGIDVNLEKRAAVQNMFAKGILANKLSMFSPNSTAKNPTGIKSYEMKEKN